MTSVRLDKISKHFGSTVALDGIDLTIATGELFFLLGPSGCGKSTLLRLIAGLHDADAGRIWFNDRDVTRLGTENRNAVMCFQSYALWPHMTVRENVAFGLGVRKLPRQQIDCPCRPGAADRSDGGVCPEKTRAAIRRAATARCPGPGACRRTGVPLLDEPLSNLDTKLRQEMRSEIRRICKSSGFTTIYVTHDQKEALSVADRIAVMQAGRIIQVGSPAEMYRRPVNSFVADFMGSTNLVPGKRVEGSGDVASVETRAGRLSGVLGSGRRPLARRRM